MANLWRKCILSPDRDIRCGVIVNKYRRAFAATCKQCCCNSERSRYASCSSESKGSESEQHSNETDKNNCENGISIQNKNEKGANTNTTTTTTTTITPHHEIFSTYDCECGMKYKVHDDKLHHFYLRIHCWSLFDLSKRKPHPQS